MDTESGEPNELAAEIVGETTIVESSPVVADTTTTSSKEYNIASLRSPLSISEIGRDIIGFHHVYGYDSSRKGNVHFIEDDRIIFVDGSTVVLENIHDGSREFILGSSECGAACVAVHPSRKYFAVGGRGFHPNILIYSYPALKIEGVLRGGAELGYSCMDYSADGEMLASVSTSPDFMLTIWDWRDEKMGLHSKAFGQDVWNVRFSKDDNRRLTTSGIGHIRFWKMASTFTGLKLQGYIGKFGKIDLSDIESFVELPDGKVLSGTEAGSLLLWEGNFIKCRFVLVGGKPCHGAPVTYVGLDRVEQTMITASSDGMIKWWDFSSIDTAEVDSDHSMDFELLPLAEYKLPDGLGVKSLVDGGLHNKQRVFVAFTTAGSAMSIRFLPASNEVSQDRDMRLVQVINNFRSSEVTATDLVIAEDAAEEKDFILETKKFGLFHAGRVVGLDSSPICNWVATCGTDGKVFVVNAETRKLVAYREFRSPATSLVWLGTTLDPRGLSLAVGFADGSLRILSIDSESGSDPVLSRKLALKPHNGSISCLSFSADESYLASAGRDGTVFFFKCKPPAADTPLSIEPIRFINLNTMAQAGPGSSVFCTQLDWSNFSSNVLLSCSDKIVREADISELYELGFVDNKDALTYEISLPYRSITPIVDVVTSRNGVMKLYQAQQGHAESKTEGDPTTDTPASPVKASKNSKDESEPTKCITKVGCLVYTSNRSEKGFFGTLALNSNQHMLCEINRDDTNKFKEMNLGLYSADGKDYRKYPEPRDIAYSKSKRFVTISLSDGTVQVRPSDYLEVFCSAAAHNGLTLGATKAILSFDDRYVFSIGNDGCLVSYRIRSEVVKSLALPLYKDLDAGVFGNNLTRPETLKEEPKFLSFVSSYHEDAQFLEYFGPDSPPVVDIQPVEVIQEVQDVTPESYSIQDNRLKLEEDAKKSAAEELKSRVKASVRALRKDYEKILKENETVPALVRLKPSELTIDGTYFEILAKYGYDMKEEVHRERAYFSEISERRLQKLRKRLTPDLLMEEMCLSSFDIDDYRRTKDPSYSVRSSVCEVWSFRIVSLDPNVRKLVDQVRSEVRQQELRESQQRSNDIAQKKALDAMEDMKQRLLKKEDPSKQEGGQNDKPTENASAEDASAARLRLKMRKERKEELLKHLHAKPSENDDDERDVMAIRIAEKTIGDFKLKCADDYEVPEEQRINAVKKLRQMAMLEESMLMLRLKFNERFLYLRSLKKEIIVSTSRCNSRIRDIDSELNQEHLSYHLWQPALNPVEFPDDFEEVSKQELSDYKAQLKETSWEKSTPPMQLSAKGDRLSVSINKKSETLEVARNGLQVKPVREDRSQLQIQLFDPQEETKGDVTELTKKYYEVNENFISSCTPVAHQQDSSQVALDKLIPSLSFARALTQSKMKTPVTSSHHKLLVDRRRQALLFEREMTLKNIESNILSFKEAIDELRADRHRIASDLKLSEFKLLSLFQEYRLLLTFEGRDNALHQKQLRCKGEESEIITLSFDNKSKLEGKTEEIQTWNEKLTQITSEFKALLPESHPYIETLTKIFKKKIKRSKPGAENENEDEEEEEFEDDDDEEEDDEEVEDICPPGCDQALFEKILELREKKLDTEEVCNEIQKCIDDLKKTSDRLKQREKQIIKEAQQTEYEVQQFQLQKQAALNQIKVVVPMRISQIFSFESSGTFTGPMDKVVESVPVGGEEGNVQNEDTSPDSNRRLLAHISMATHSLFSTRNLGKLKDRIDGLHLEIDKAKDDFRELHKDRSKLAKEREVKETETDMWKNRCRELQLLKFGREIDLDELESSSDRTREREMEGQLSNDREKFEADSRRLLKDVHVAKEQYIQITKENTRQLHELARLMELKVKIASELNAPGQNVTPSTTVEDFREVEERKRIKAYTRFQATELEALRAELNMLKRKEAPIFSYSSAPSAPMLRSSSARRGEGAVPQSIG